MSREEDELVEKEIRDRFKKMCEGYFESVSKKLVIEHNVSRTGFAGVYMLICIVAASRTRP